MNLATTLVLALALAMDAFSVSIASGAVYKRFNVAHAFRIAFFFGFFQAFMPIVGWLCGLTFKHLIESVDHWIAFGLLGVVGLKMIYEAFKLEESDKKTAEMTIGLLLTLSIATSIDALAVGLTLSLITNHIFITVVMIGLVTFILSYLGVFIGKHFGHIFENKIEMIGGLILILLGFKILVQHLCN